MNTISDANVSSTSTKNSIEKRQNAKLEFYKMLQDDNVPKSTFTASKDKHSSTSLFEHCWPENQECDNFFKLVDKYKTNTLTQHDIESGSGLWLRLSENGWQTLNGITRWTRDEDGMPFNCLQITNDFWNDFITLALDIAETCDISVCVILGKVENTDIDNYMAKTKQNSSSECIDANQIFRENVHSAIGYTDVTPHCSCRCQCWIDSCLLPIANKLTDNQWNSFELRFSNDDEFKCIDLVSEELQQSAEKFLSSLPDSMMNRQNSFQLVHYNENAIGLRFIKQSVCDYIKLLCSKVDSSN